MQDEDGGDDAGETASDAYDTLKGAIEARSMTPKHKAAAGCFVGIANDGSLSIDYGRTKPVEGKSGTNAVTGARGGTADPQAAFGERAKCAPRNAAIRPPGSIRKRRRNIDGRQCAVGWPWKSADPVCCSIWNSAEA
jgi:hypothetical protein